MASKARPKPQPRGGKKKNRRAHRNIQTRSSSPGSASSKKRPKGKSTLLGKTIKLEITDMAQGGFAMGRHRGKAVFVPYTLPGESISAEIYQDRGSAIFARGKDLYAASADRVVCILTGSGLKDPDTALRESADPINTPPDLDAVTRVLGWSD